MVSHEIRTKAVRLAEAIYRISGIESFDSVLKFELRKRSIEILTALATLERANSNASTHVRERIQELSTTLKDLIRVGVDTRCIGRENAALVDGAYDQILEAVQDVKPADFLKNIIATPIERRSPPGLNQRQMRIMDYMNGNKRLQISNLRSVFGTEVSEKTLQRDLGELVSYGLLKRQGDNRWTTYVALGQI